MLKSVLSERKMLRYLDKIQVLHKQFDRSRYFTFWSFSHFMYKNTTGDITNINVWFIQQTGTQIDLQKDEEGKSV